MSRVMVLYYTCDLCGQSGLTEDDMLTHRLLAHTECEVSCMFCDLSGVTAEEMAYHINAAHSDHQPASPTLTELRTAVNHVNIDDELKTIEENRIVTQLQCPVCLLEFSNKLKLEMHVENHFEADHSDLLFPESGYVDNNRGLFEEMENGEMQPTAGTSASGISSNFSVASSDDRDSLLRCSSGILERIQGLSYGQGNSKVKARHFCAPTDHFQSNGWDCGYRNLQMLLSCLFRNPVFSQALSNGSSVMPSVLKLQKLIEAAWSKGFDAYGSSQMNGKVVGTKKWIGATDVVALLTSLCVKCEIYDFHVATGPKNTHPLLLQFVCNYFKNTQQLFLPPLFLQHQGHSRTIVGIEETSTGDVNLMVFDPGCDKMAHLLTANAKDLNGKMSLLRRSSSMLNHKQYQVIKVVGILAATELENYKKITSIRIP